MSPLQPTLFSQGIQPPNLANSSVTQQTKLIRVKPGEVINVKINDSLTLRAYGNKTGGILHIPVTVFHSTNQPEFFQLAGRPTFIANTIAQAQLRSSPPVEHQAKSSNLNKHKGSSLSQPVKNYQSQISQKAEKKEETWLARQGKKTGFNVLDGLCKIASGMERASFHALNNLSMAFSSIII